METKKEVTSMVVFSMQSEEFTTLSKETFDELLSDGTIRYSETLELYVID